MLTLWLKGLTFPLEFLRTQKVVQRLEDDVLSKYPIVDSLLCQKGIQYGQSGQYMLYAHYARMGLAQNRISSYPDMFGTLHTTSRLVWTEKGEGVRVQTQWYKNRQDA